MSKYNFAIFSIFRLHLVSIFFSLALFSSGCTRYELYDIVPRHRSQIKWYDAGHWCTWALLGNDDDGIFGEDAEHPYMPDEPPSFKKFVFWTCRNPLHNFCFYVIGTAYCTNSELSFIRIGDGSIKFLEYSPAGGHVFGGKGTSFHLALHGWKPFISLRLCYCPHRSTQFYFGWRERGNFGMKFTPLKKRHSL